MQEDHCKINSWCFHDSYYKYETSTKNKTTKIKFYILLSAISSWMFVKSKILDDIYSGKNKSKPHPFTLYFCPTLHIERLSWYVRESSHPSLCRFTKINLHRRYLEDYFPIQTKRQLLLHLCAYLNHMNYCHHFLQFLYLPLSLLSLESETFDWVSSSLFGSLSWITFISETKNFIMNMIKLLSSRWFH